ncbi:hypothetical protein FHL15_002590 [Xylaria flabelliformis]|uniref:Uncharacterized protein n=1 Tax=Xylaria flabelliformis TaxID=2512241 RepID=A0A553I7Z9_9PEZI|nr:hypothetical protein FHL15_002590 [Xylaria flabelliformis]
MSAISDELSIFADFHKRQEPGSAAYSCHEACGQAILAARASKDVCSDDDFLTNYDTCLKCSGPDNIDIWKIYGQTLSGFGEICGLSTIPVSNGPGDLVSENSTVLTSTTSSGSMTSLPISITAPPTMLATTAIETSAISVIPTPTTSETVVTTGVVPVSAADALSGNGLGPYLAAVLVALCAIA